MRPIDADALKVQGWKLNRIVFGKTTATYEMKDLDDVPTVDAVPVVRCKDCQHYWKNNPSDDVPACLASPKDDAFCSFGERREDAEIQHP